MRKQLTAAAIATCLALLAVRALAGSVDVDYMNATFRIDNEDVKLSNGERTVPAAPGSATQHVTRLFGKPVVGQLDFKPAAAGFLADEPGGSGTFMYVALVFGDCSEANAVLLGDRIEPLSIAFHDHYIAVTYLDRKPDEPMTAIPTVMKRVKLAAGPTCQLAE